MVSGNYLREDNPLTYEPELIDTSGVKLPTGVRKLIDELAENNHDLWAQLRIAEGWTYGPKRDDIKKTNPDLVPYHNLLESEKQYDRTAAIEVLKAIIALGYIINPPPKKPSAHSDFLPKVAEEVVQRLKSSEKVDLPALLKIWAPLSSKYWAGSSGIYELLGNRILKVGEPLLAYDVISVGLEHWPKNVRLDLPKELNLRISLHAGPASLCEDPVLQRHKYTGSHVSRTARIETITPPGEVYASQAFAALASVQRVKGFALEYVGQATLPKEADIVPLYLVGRTTP